MTTIQHNMWGHPARRGLSGLVIALILVGIGAGATFAVMGGVLDNLDSMASTNRVVIESVTAYTDSDRMVIVGNIKNLGSQPIESVTVDEITAGDLILTQSAHTADGVIDVPHGDLTLSGLDDLGDQVSAGPNGSNSTTPADPTSGLKWTTDGIDGYDYYFETGNSGMAAVKFTGLSTDEDELVSLPAGSTQSFRITILGKSAGGSADVLDILRTVPASTSLFITISGTDGQTSTISDPRTVRVTDRS